MTALALVHHVYDGRQGPGATDYAGGWATGTVSGHPPVTEASELALRHQVMSPRDKAREPVKLHHCEGWNAVVDLHRAGRHNDAMDLAKLLHWCDSQANGRIPGIWEIVAGSA